MAFELKHVDDGKQKWQSHEYHLDCSSDIGRIDFFSVNASGYGGTKKEAAAELLTTIQSLQNTLNSAVDQLLTEIDLPIDRLEKRGI